MATRPPHPTSRAMRWWAALTSSTIAPDADTRGRYYREFTAEAGALGTVHKLTIKGRKWRIWNDGSRVLYEKGMDHAEHMHLSQTIYLQTYPVEEE